MADFYQHEPIATLHRLADRSLGSLETELREFAARRPVALIIPALYDELAGGALGRIVDELCEVDYLGEIIVGIDRADERQFREARHFFSRLPQRTRLLWNDGPRLRGIDDALADHVLAPTAASTRTRGWSSAANRWNNGNASGSRAAQNRSTRAAAARTRTSLDASKVWSRSMSTRLWCW